MTLTGDMEDKRAISNELCYDFMQMDEISGFGRERESKFFEQRRIGGSGYSMS